MRRIGLSIALALCACSTPTTQRPAVDEQATSAERQTELAAGAAQTGTATGAAPAAKTPVDPVANFNRQRDWFERVWRVSYRLATGSAALCKDHLISYLGAHVDTMKNMPEAARAAAQARYPSLGDRVSVIYVVPGSAAEKAGLAPGDVIDVMNGVTLDVGASALKSWNVMLAKVSTGPVNFVVGRAASELRLTVEPVSACNYPVIIVGDPAIDAVTDGRTIAVTRGMMEFTQSDEELAVVIGHEMAHDLRGHTASRHTNATVGSVLGAIFDVAIAAGTGVYTNTFSRLGGGAGAGAYSQEFEAEADYVGLYLMARAGYKIDGAANFWRRMGAAAPKTITVATDHPTAPERFVALAATIQEIDAKEARGEDLVPSEKPDKAKPAGTP